MVMAKVKALVALVKSWVGEVVKALVVTEEAAEEETVVAAQDMVGGEGAGREAAGRVVVEAVGASEEVVTMMPAVAVVGQ